MQAAQITERALLSVGDVMARTMLGIEAPILEAQTTFHATPTATRPEPVLRAVQLGEVMPFHKRLSEIRIAPPVDFPELATWDESGQHPAGLELRSAPTFEVLV